MTCFVALSTTTKSGGWPGFAKLIFVDMGIEERISLRHFSGKYREAESAPGSFFSNMGRAVDVSFRGLCAAAGAVALRRARMEVA
jgi:hypothetical protein